MPTTATPPDLTTLLATPDAFQTWLETQPPHVEVGHREEPSACPLAHWLHAAGYPALLVEPDCLSDRNVPRHVRPLPPWAMRFVTFLDDHRPTNVPVVQAEAQLVLSWAVREEETP